jgi:hypothetical protein
MKIKISELPAGMIIWKKGNILGITKATLPLKYYKYYCVKIPGNDFDYELVVE